MQTVIMAGGKGSRLKPVTENTPKSLLGIGGIPILEVIIKQLQNNDTTEVILAVNHLKQKIQSYFKNGDKLGVKIVYSSEDKPLGTAAPLKRISNLENDFLVINGDILTNLSYRDLFRYHLKNRAILTVSSFEISYEIDYGILKTSNSNEIIEYIEKPESNYRVSMGVYAMNKKALNYIPEDTRMDMPYLINMLIKNNEKVIIFPFKGYWFDIGSRQNIEEAEKIFSKHKTDFIR